MEQCDKTIVALRQNRPSVNRSLGVPALQLEQFTVLWILFIVIVAGNVGVLYTLIFGRSRKSRMNYFITHLALADLCVGLISVLTDIIWKITVSWYAGNVACKVIKFSQVVVTYASTYVLVALSIDRYDAIRHPMKFSGSSRIVLRLNGVLWAKFGVATPLFIVNAVCFVRIYLAKWKRAKCLIIAAWIFSVIFSTPILIFYEQKNVHGMVQCWIEFEEKWHWQLYMTLVSVSLFVVPASIIATCYAVIITTIWTKSSRGGFVKTPKHGGRGGGRLGSDNSRRASSRGLIPRAKVKTIKITFVIVSVFIMCWSPYIIFDLLQVYGHVPDTQANIAISTFVQSLAPLNSAANPIIYCLFSTHFCRSLCLLPPFKWLLMRKKRRNVDSANNTQSSSLSEFLTNTHHKRRVVEATSTNNAHTVLMH